MKSIILALAALISLQANAGTHNLICKDRSGSIKIVNNHVYIRGSKKMSYYTEADVTRLANVSVTDFLDNMTEDAAAIFIPQDDNGKSLANFKVLSQTRFKDKCQNPGITTTFKEKIEIYYFQGEKIVSATEILCKETIVSDDCN